MKNFALFCVLANVEMQVHGNICKEWSKCYGVVWGATEIGDQSGPFITAHWRSRKKEGNEKNQGKVCFDVNKKHITMFLL